MQTPTLEPEGHEQSGRHTTTKWTKEKQWYPVNHQIQGAGDRLTAWQEIRTAPRNPVCCEGKTQRQPRRLRAQEPAEQMNRGFVDESEEQRKREGQTVDLENKRKEDTDQARHGGTVILPADTGGSQSSRPASVTEWVQGKSGKPNEILSQNKR